MQRVNSHQSKSHRPDQPIQFGPYKLHELINSGGMADLWLATDEQGRTLGIKKQHGHFRFNLVAWRRFVRGCEVLAHLHHHDYVIGYVGHGKINGSRYLAMEYVEGVNLKQLMAQADDALAEHIGNVLIDSALALEHVHESGYMHLDFKPENVLVTRNYSVRLVDFDLAQPRPDKPRKASRYPGTPAYMAPELLLRQPFDHRVDIFAYGAMAYELLTFRKPFPGEHAREVLRRQLDRADFFSPRQLNPDIPFALEKIILKCLETPPDDRYPYMSVVVRDLQKALYV